MKTKLLFSRAFYVHHRLKSTATSNILNRMSRSLPVLVVLQLQTLVS